MKAGKIEKSCPNCQKTFKTISGLDHHFKTLSCTRDNKYCVWKSSYPIDEKTFDKIKSGGMESTCPNCKKTFANHRFLFRHFATTICKKDQKAVEPSPNMVLVIKNEGEKHRLVTIDFHKQRPLL